MMKSKVSVLGAAFLMVCFFAFSLSAAEYKNAELGFSVSYPDVCDKQDPMKGTIFYAIAPTKMPWFTVAVMDGASLEATFKSGFAGNSDISGVDIKPAKEIVTDSGIKGQAAEVKYMWQGTYECEGIALGIQKNGKLIISTLMTVPMYDTTYTPTGYEKILKTFKFDK